MKPERIPYGGDPQQFCELWRPQQTTEGFVIFLHGGFWRAKYDLHHADPFCGALAARGLITANLEYRRVGQPGGGWPGTFEDILSGVQAASAHVGQMPVIVGHSAGGHLALRAASEAIPLRAIVALAPVADLRLAHQLNLSHGAVAGFLGGTPDSVPDRYEEACPSHRESSTRTFMVHGTKDEDVPIVVSRAFQAARKNDANPPRMIELLDAGHMELIDPESTAGTMVLDLVVRVAKQ